MDYKGFLNSLFKNILEKVVENKEYNNFTYQMRVIKTRADIDAFIAKHSTALITIECTSPKSKFSLEILPDIKYLHRKEVYKIVIVETFDSLDIYNQDRQEQFIKIN